MVAMVRGIRVHENEVEVFQWTLCNVAAYFADDSVMRMGVLSHQRTFPLPGIVKQDMNTPPPQLQAMLIKHANGSQWDSLRPHSVK